MRRMMTRFTALAAALLAASPSSAFAGAANFTLVNATGAAMTDVSIRRSGTQEWRPLPVTPPPGARAPVQFSEEDCAFDVRATLANGKTVVWPGVNLCETKVVALNRSESGEAWVDYD
jgi:hypothetical protein